MSEWNDPRSVWYAARKKSSDPQVVYNLGWNYMDKADRLRSNPRNTPLTVDEKRKLASVVWQNDQRLDALYSEWNSEQLGGPVEKTFQNQLRNLALEAMDQALLKKGRRIMPELYFDRALVLMDQENYFEAENAFMAAINEVSKTTVVQTKQEILVMSHYDLGVIKLRQGKYDSSLQWLKLTEEEQSRFGGNWVPDISKKRKILESYMDSLKIR